MSHQTSLKTIAARVAGLRQTMEAVMNGSTPDHAKWIGINLFVTTYCDLASQYVALTGDSTVNNYDTSKLKNSPDMLWPDQKGLFDKIYLDTQILSNIVTQTKPAPTRALYNLFVSGFDDSWTGKPFEIELSRCVREYTTPNLTNRYGNLDADSIAELKRAPCIFAYEGEHKLPPQFGYIREIVQRQRLVRVEYDLHQVEPFLTAEDLKQMTLELDIGNLELFRTHWAVKEVNLPKELHARGIALPFSAINAVDISKHVFDVALSFPGEIRSLIETITPELERELGPNAYFYDNNYVSQLAQPSLDTLLQGVYSRAKLNVVFLSADYQKKDWCYVEFRAVQEIIHSREKNRIMYVRTDDGDVEGVFKTDGYIDARKFDAAKIAEFICQRLDVL